MRPPVLMKLGGLLMTFLASCVVSLATPACSPCCDNEVSEKELPTSTDHQILEYWSPALAREIDHMSFGCPPRPQNLGGASGIEEPDDGAAGEGGQSGMETVLWGEVDISSKDVVFHYTTDRGEYRVTWAVGRRL